jgi:CDP-diacylglycerol--glycerol-3-phosphate 3-phosphatidyltransferase
VELLKKIYINILTSLRMPLGVLFIYFTLIDYNIGYLILIFILTAFSDYFDGKLAAKYNLNTYDGAKLDVICDFIFIVFSTVAVILIDLIPFWFIFVIILKLIEFFITSLSNDFYYETWGHIVALMFYAYPIVALLIHVESINTALAVFITICALTSSVSRIKK